MLAPIIKTVMLTVALVSSTVSNADSCKRCGVVVPHKTTFEKKEMTKIIGTACHRLNTKLSIDQWRAMYRIAYKESSWRSTLRNKRSTAYGLFQFLNQTWKDVGIPKTNCPYCQAEGAILYIKQRYKTPTRALQFHNSRGWY